MSEDIVERLREPCFDGRCSRVRAEAADEIERLRAENAALLKDAERYWWLRGDAPEFSERWMRWEIKRWDGRSWHTLERSTLDAAIDAALAAKEQQP